MFTHSTFLCHGSAQTRNGTAVQTPVCGLSFSLRPMQRSLQRKKAQGTTAASQSGAIQQRHSGIELPTALNHVVHSPSPLLLTKQSHADTLTVQLGGLTVDVSGGSVHAYQLPEWEDGQNSDDGDLLYTNTMNARSPSTPEDYSLENADDSYEPCTSARSPVISLTRLQQHPRHLRPFTMREVVQELNELQPRYELLDKALDVALNSTLPVLAARGEARAFKELLKYMTERKRMSEHTYAMVICSYAQTDNLTGALKAWREWCRKGVNIGPAGASALLKAATQRRDLEMAMTLLKDLQASGTPINLHGYNCVLALCGTLGRVTEALQIYKKMKRRGGPTFPDATTYRAMIHAFVAGKKFEELPKLMQDLRERKVGTLGSPVWSALLSALGKYKKGMLVDEVCATILATGHQPNRQVYNAALAALARCGKKAEVMQYYQRFLKRGLAPDEYTFNALLTVLGKAGTTLEDVQQVVADMNAWGIQLNVFLGTSLLNAYRRTNEIMYPDTAPQVLQAAGLVVARLKRQQSTNTNLFTCLITLYIQSGDIGSAMKLLKDLKASGARLEVASLEILAHTSENAGFFAYAEQFRTDAQRLRIENSRQVRQGKRLARGVPP